LVASAVKLIKVQLRDRACTDQALVEMMRQTPRIDMTYLVHWIIFLAVVMAVVGIAIQLYRFGAVIEPGSMGPAGE
jgi:hypothetical protein